MAATTPETLKIEKRSSSDFVSEEKTKAETVSGIFPIVDVCLVNICDCKLEEKKSNLRHGTDVFFKLQN